MGDIVISPLADVPLVALQDVAAALSRHGYEMSMLLANANDCDLRLIADRGWPIDELDKLLARWRRDHQDAMGDIPWPSADEAHADEAARLRDQARRDAAGAALERLKRAAVVVADILDAGERDPTWHESQELEEAAIAYGRAVREVAP